MRTRELTFTLAAATMALAACSATEVRQSEWAKSPSGRWETRLVERDTSGPGNNSLYKDVEVRRIGADEGIRVLTIDEGQGASGVSLRWRSQTRLDVTYESAPLLFQVARLGELTIAVVEVPKH